MENVIGRFKNPLLVGFEKHKERNKQNSILQYGTKPYDRDITSYLNKGFINLDKPEGPSSHDACSWIKKILKVSKSGHIGTLDPNVSGSLLILLGRSTKLAPLFSKAIKEYVCAAKISFHSKSFSSSIKNLNTKDKFCEKEKKERKEKVLKEALNFFTGPLYQRPPLASAVKRRLRIRTIYSNEFLDFDNRNNILLFKTKCEAGTYIRTLCLHIGLFLGGSCEMIELRRIKSGIFEESLCKEKKGKFYDSMEKEIFHRTFSLHEVLDSFKGLEEGICFNILEVNLYLKRIKNHCKGTEFYSENDLKSKENYLKTVVKPLEALFINYKKVFVDDGAISSLAIGSKLSVRGILRYDSEIKKGELIVLVSIKGEVIYVGEAMVDFDKIDNMDYGLVVRPKIVLMEENYYPKNWNTKEKCNK